MKDYEWKNTIYSKIREICHYSQMQVFATSHYQRNYFQHQIDALTDVIIDLLSTWSQNSPYPESQETREISQTVEISQDLPEETQEPKVSDKTGEVRVFTREELATYDGSNGRAAYVAVNGTVYDVSDMPRWAGGTHFGLLSGNDLSQEFMTCHAGISDVINRLPVVGVLQQ